MVLAQDAIAAQCYRALYASSLLCNSMLDKGVHNQSTV